jgi:hypothetical protein
MEKEMRNRRSPAVIVYVFIAICICAPLIGFMLWVLRTYVMSR